MGFDVSSRVPMTVAIPVFNTDRYLEECISSVISQTQSDIEIICVDDGSTDDSLAILRDFASSDERISIVETDRGGLSAARNSALSLASGEYVLFVDSDDRIQIDACQILLDCAESAEFPDLIVTRIEAFTDDEALAELNNSYNHYYRQAGSYAGKFSGPGLLSAMAANNDWLPSAVTKLFRKNLAIERDISFLEGVVFEDNLFSMQLGLAAKTAVVCPGVSYQRRLRSNSIMTREIGAQKIVDSLTITAAMMNVAIQAEGLSPAEANGVSSLLLRMMHQNRDILNKLNQDDLRLFMQKNTNPMVAFLFEMIV